MKIESLLLTLAIVPTVLFGRVVETGQLEDLLHYVETMPPKTWVVFDLDNTLMMPKGDLGSAAWGDHVLQQLLDKGVSEKEAETVQHILWRTVQPHLAMRTVDPKTLEILHAIKRNGNVVMGLTSRYPDDAPFTFKQLRSVGLDFSRQHQLPENSREIALEPSALYAEGVLFSTMHNRKSDVLIKFIELHQLDVENIVFVDDKPHHVQDVERACSGYGIKCLGVRFSGADPFVENYDPIATQLQWEAFRVE